jgi:hypothetical protein
MGNKSDRAAWIAYRHSMHYPYSYSYLGTLRSQGGARVLAVIYYTGSQLAGGVVLFCLYNLVHGGGTHVLYICVYYDDSSKCQKLGFLPPSIWQTQYTYVSRNVGHGFVFQKITGYSDIF